MIGAVSPAARLTCRMMPVRIPLIALGRTTALMVCQRVAPTFQQASRKLRGTLASASRVLAMITGSVMIASVSEAEMIDKIFDLGETAVREVMVPLVDVAALPETASPADVVRLIQERGFSRIPVFTERVFNIVGVVTAMDLLRRGAEAHDLRALMRPATYVPETKRIDDLLREMQKNRLQLAVVVDEYGGAVGIVTVEDIVEEVVGEIRDEHDRTPDTVERLPDGSYRVAGRASLEEVNDALEWDLPKGDFETVAGLVLATLHRIPLVGEVFRVRRYTVTVLEADKRRVLAVRITPETPKKTPEKPNP